MKPHLVDVNNPEEVSPVERAKAALAGAAEHADTAAHAALGWASQTAEELTEAAAVMDRWPGLRDRFRRLAEHITAEVTSIQAHRGKLR